MNVYLMFRDHDFEPKATLSPLSATLVQDLGLDAVFAAMAGGDEILLEVARTAVLASLGAPEEIEYRQRILEDSLAQPAVVREIYAVAVETLARERRIWGWTLNRYPEALLHRSLEALELFLEMLRRLRRIAERHGGAFRSEGFTRLFDMLRTELDEPYLREVEDHVQRLALRHGMLLAAQLGEGNKAAGYSLRRSEAPAPGMLERLQSWAGRIAGAERSSYVYEIDPRDEAGAQALGEIRSRGLSVAAIRTGHAADHIVGFFALLRAEVGFYVGCLNLRDRLEHKGAPIAIPQAVSARESALAARGLYDVALELSMEERVVGNDLSADGKRLILITGANRGGKTTFHRSLGQAQLMMQCGLFVPAESFRASVCAGVFTHYKREEDPGLTMGKLDEELNRMSAIVDRAAPGCLLLCNESFASTNEREGSEIARQIVQALVEAGVEVIYVTHLFDLARGFYDERLKAALFLRAERLPNGHRTFRVIEGGPLPTSHGPDLYRQIFGAAGEQDQAAAWA